MSAIPVIPIYTEDEPGRQPQHPIPTTGWAITTARRRDGSGVHATLFHAGHEIASTFIHGEPTTGEETAVAVLGRIADAYPDISRVALLLHERYGDPAEWWQPAPTLDAAYTEQRDAAAAQAAAAGWDRRRFAEWFRSYVRTGAPYPADV